MSKYKLVIFDFDGTLFNTHEAIIYCVTKTFEKFNKKVPDAKNIFQTITKGISLDETFKQLINTQDEKAINNIQEWVDTYRTIYSAEGGPRTKPFDHAKVVLQHIHSQGIIIVVISNKGVDAINTALTTHGLKEFVTLVVGDTKGINKKPDRMIFDKIIQPSFASEKAEEIIVIGDTTADLLFAKNIGVDACWAKYGYGDHEQCKSCGSAYTIQGLQELFPLFEKRPAATLKCT